MAEKPFTRLMTMAANDPALRAELGAAPDPSAVVRIAERHGVTLTESDLRKNGELDDADLGLVGGGTLQLTYNPWTCQD